MIVILCKGDVSIVEVIDMAYGNIITNVSIKRLEGEECTRGQSVFEHASPKHFWTDRLKPREICYYSLTSNSAYIRKNISSI
jgi:hypothetical protein